MPIYNSEAYKKWQEKYGVSQPTTNKTTNSGKQSNSASSNKSKSAVAGAAKKGTESGKKVQSKTTSNSDLSKTKATESKTKSAYEAWQEKYVKNETIVPESTKGIGLLGAKVGVDAVAPIEIKQKEILNLIQRMETAKSKTTDEYYEKRYLEEYDRLTREHANENYYPAAAQADNIVLGEMEAAEKEVEEITKQLERLQSGAREANWYDSTIGAIGRGYLGMKAGKESYKKMQGYENEADAYNKKLATEHNTYTDNKAKQVLQFIGEFIGQQAYNLSDPRTIGLTITGAGTAAAAGQAGPQIAAPEEIISVPAGAIVGYTSGASLNTYEVSAGNTYETLKKLGVSDEVARNTSYGTGMVVALLESMQLDELVDAYTFGVKSGAADDLLKVIGNEIIKRTKNSAVETTEEVLQEIASIGGESIAYGIDKGENLYSWEEIQKRLDDTATTSLVGFGAMNVPAVAFNTARAGINSRANNVNNNPVNVTQGTTESAVEPQTQKETKTSVNNNATQRTTTNNTNTLTQTTSVDPIEQAAREVVAERNRNSPVLAVETMSINGETITPEDARKASGYGKHGSELLANATNNAEGKSFSEVKGEMHEAYVAGRTNRNININSDFEQEAYFAGKKDKVLQDMEDSKNASNIVVNKESGFSTENLPNDVTKTQAKILDIIAKALGVKSYMTSGLKGNAEYDRTTGEAPIDVSFERKSKGRKVSIVYHGAHEMAVHAVVDRSGEVGREFVREMYKFLAGDEKSNVSLAEQKRNAYAKQGVEISFEQAMEEVVANDILTLYGNNEAKFKRAIENIANGTNTKAKQGLRKYIDLLNKIIMEIKMLLQGKTASEKAKMRAELNEVIRLRDMFESAYGTAAENVQTAKAKSTETDVRRENSSEIKSEPKTEPKHNPDVSEQKSSDTKTKPEYPSVKVGDVYVSNGNTYTITKRENGRTTYTVTRKDGGTSTKEVSNVVADINFTKEDAYQKISDVQLSLKDTDYMEAVENNDMETAQKMVDDKAKKAGAFTTKNGEVRKFYHGTRKPFNSFDAEKSRFGTYGFGFYFSPSESMAVGYGDIKNVYLMTDKFATRTDHNITARQVKKFAEKYGLDLSKTILRNADTIKQWVSLNNDLTILEGLQEFVRKDANYTNETLLKDLSKYFGYDGISENTEYVLWDNHLVKSADPVTYDDNDNVIPLSERFNEKDDDIRYSLKEDTDNLSPEDKKVVDALGKGAGVITNKNGDMLIATNKDKNTIMYSLKTYEDGGKEKLEQALRANGHTEEEIQKTLSYVDDAADYLKILAAGYARTHNYTALSNHLIADVITNVKTGKQVISSIVNNGDYPVNIDLALICKKRVAYMNLMNRLIDDGVFDKVNYGGEAIAKVNDLLRMDGFETACLGCFVESRRLQFQTWAEAIVSEWNEEVDKRTKNASNFNFADGKAKLTDAEMDALAEELKNAGKKNPQGNLNLGQGSVQARMGRLLDKVPSLRKHLTVADLLKPDGLTALRAYDSNLFSIVKSRYGAASPKIVQDYNPYASEISMLTFSSVKNITSNAVKGADVYRRKVINEMGGRPVKQKGETAQAFEERKAEFNTKVEDEAIRRYLYDIGGARIQSFSDFMIENVFDYIQIFADLSAKRLPLHGYTKEIIALRLFGMTGAKWNGSWIAHVDRSMGKEYAGLLPAGEAKDGSAILVHTEDGDYAIGFDDYARHKATNKKSFIQSIGMKDMMALQLDPRYSPYVGSITIGVSDKQILAMLDSPLFRFVIPYHSSGMLPQFAKLVGVDLYNDYTDYQNTTVKQWYDSYGNPCNPISDVVVDTSYNFNAEVQKTGDARKAAANYLKWCDNKHPVYGKGKKLVGYVTFNPKFSNSPYGTDFTKHENYYKLLEDFNVYDNITEESAVQGAVTMNFPSEENRLSASEMEAYKERLRDTGIFSEKEIEKYSAIADKTFKELIADEVKGRAEYQQAQAPKWENTVKNVEQMLLGDHARTSFSLKGTNDMSIEEQRALSGIVDDAKSGDKEAMGKLAKYVDSGSISTEYYDSLIEKYGAIPYGENPSRDIQVPKKTAKDKKVSQTVRTILEAKATPDEALPTIEKMVEDGVFSYDVYTDKQAIKDSEDYLKEYGWSESYNDWMKDVEKGIVSKQHTVMGWALYNNAVNTATTTTSETEKRTAMGTALNVLDAMVRHQRNAAQALQATRVLKKLSPETQLYAVQKSVSAFQKELTDKYGKKAPDLKIDEELAEQFLTAETDEERAEIEKEIYKDIGRQMPSRFIDKWNAWRYLAMLGNLRTHGRNIVGNAGFAPVVVAKNLTATAIESVVHRVSGKKTVRGKSIITGNKADRALLKAAWGDYANVGELISNGGKYNDSAMANQNIEEGRQIFKFKPLEMARKGNSKLLEKEDMWFAQPHYAYALAQYCKANNITAEQIQKGTAIAPARAYAIKEAQKATYRDTNAFSQMVSEWGRKGNNDNVVKKSVSTVIEGILPFRKTPANILVRGVEYSPIGLLKGLTYDLVQVSKGKMTSSEAIDNISAGLTGTGLLALGVLLASQGLVRGHGEDEKEEKEFKEMMGHQSYALELPNGQSITLDWLAPEALPFFVGVNLWGASKGDDEKVNLSTILKSVSTISEPMLEMSCLQGLNDLFEGVGNAASNDTSGLVSVLSSAVTSYLTQAIPTLLGQAERTGEENRMTTYTEKNSFLTGDMQYTLGKASAKIPFWDYNQIPYIDAWGRKEASGSALKRGGHNFLNPAYTSEIKTSGMEKELLRLYEATGEESVFPSRADKYFTVDEKRKDLTAEEYVRYATLKGEKSYKAVTELVTSKGYKKLSNQEKVKAIEKAYDYANQKAKQAISNYKPQKWVTTADEFGSNVGTYLTFKSELSSAKDENDGKISKLDVVDIILDSTQNDDDMWKLYFTEYGSNNDAYAYNNGIEGGTYMEFLQTLNEVDKPNDAGKYGTFTQAEATEAVKQIEGLTQKEKATLYQSVNTTWKKNPFR